MTAVASPPLERRRLDGSYAGGVTRLLGYVIDVLVVTTTFAVGVMVVEYVVSHVLPVELDLSDQPVVSAVALVVWSFVYFTLSLATSGRTVGKAIVGTRVVRSDGGDLGSARAAARVVAMPLSFAVGGLGLLSILVRADRRALHDLVAGTAEVYCWQRGPEP